MDLYTLADWSVVVAAMLLTVTLAGAGVGKVFTLMHRVDTLEDWASHVAVGLNDLTAEVDRLRERSESAGA